MWIDASLPLYAYCSARGRAPHVRNHIRVQSPHLLIALAPILIMTICVFSCHCRHLIAASSVALGRLVDQRILRGITPVRVPVETERTDGEDEERGDRYADGRHTVWAAGVERFLFK